MNDREFYEKNRDEFENGRALANFQDEILAIKHAEDSSRGSSNETGNFKGGFNEGDLTSEDMEMWEFCKRVIAENVWDDEAQEKFDSYRGKISGGGVNSSRQTFCAYMANKVTLPKVHWQLLQRSARK